MRLILAWHLDTFRKSQKVSAPNLDPDGSDLALNFVQPIAEVQKGSEPAN